MTIAVNPGLAFDIETYDGLLAFVTAHLELDAESAAQLPTLLRKAEARIDRLCMVPEREVSVAITTVSGDQTVALPIDYRHLTNARFVGTSGRPLEQVSLGYLHDQYTNLSGEPVVYAISDGSVHFGPVPDGAYTVRLTYFTKLENVTEANQTNWLLSENPDVYVYALLFQTSTWLEDLDAARDYRSEMLTIIDEINLQAKRFRRARGVRMRSPVVV
jgi:hypothetical protein